MVWYGNGGWGWGAWIAMIMMMLVFWGAIAFIVVLVLRHGRSAPVREREEAGRDATRILDERFARGEIDEDDYRKRREVLRGGV
jgi:putative membrane protein